MSTNVPSIHAGPSASSSKQIGACRSPSSMQIAHGDLVIVYLSRDRTPMPVCVTAGQELTNNFGRFPHDDMIGLPFGARMASRDGRGFIHLLRPTPELWTLALPHRTQILYTPDMSFISSHLGLSPGARLIEAGTGSGSFSHYAARCVARRHPEVRGQGWKGGQGQSGSMNGSGRTKRTVDDGIREAGEYQDDDVVMAIETQTLPGSSGELSDPPDPHVAPKEGRVWSFEFHALRASKALSEFKEHNLTSTVSLRHRNVVKDGFGLVDVADAVFLDLPAPWDVLQHAARAMRRDVAGRICCFSPCIEQVLKTVSAFRKANLDQADGEEEEVHWTDIETYECLNRTHLSMWSGTGASIGSIDDAITRIEGVEERKARRRAMQIEKAKRERLRKLQSEEGDQDDVVQESTASDRKDDGVVEPATQIRSDSKDDQPAGKRKREGSETVHSNSVATEVVNNEATPSEDAERMGVPNRANVLSRPFSEMRGHTSYLTFATLLPRAIVQRSDPTLEREAESARRKAANLERAKLRRQSNEGQTLTSTTTPPENEGLP